MEYKNNNKCKEKEIVDFDTHIKILNFLIHLQSIGTITEEQRDYYSCYIQDYLRQRNDNIEFLENLLDKFKEEETNHQCKTCDYIVSKKEYLWCSWKDKQVNESDLCKQYTRY